MNKTRCEPLVVCRCEHPVSNKSVVQIERQTLNQLEYSLLHVERRFREDVGCASYLAA